MHSRFTAAIPASMISLLAFAGWWRAPGPLHYLSLVALLSAGIMIGRFLYLDKSTYGPKGIWAWPSGKVRLLLISLTVATLFASWYRHGKGLSPMPSEIFPFVLVSMLIGATEEWVFRGVLHTEVAKFHAVFAVYGVALIFAIYKSLLFIQANAPYPTRPVYLFLITFPGAVLLGYARKSGGSMWPPLLAHMLFDLIVYADTEYPPWWVW